MGLVFPFALTPLDVHLSRISMSNKAYKIKEFVLKNSYFTYKNEYYQQTSGCAMGSPISATIANLVMEYIEEIALKQRLSCNPPRWWFRFVDDSMHVCGQNVNI